MNHKDTEWNAIAMHFPWHIVASIYSIIFARFYPLRTCKMQFIFVSYWYQKQRWGKKESLSTLQFIYIYIYKITIIYMVFNVINKYKLCKIFLMIRNCFTIIYIFFLFASIYSRIEILHTYIYIVRVTFIYIVDEQVSCQLYIMPL